MIFVITAVCGQRVTKVPCPQVDGDGQGKWETAWH